MKRLLCAAAGLALLSACGPIDYLNTVTFKASRAVAEAKTSNAEQLAPYEYWSAVEYLQMAKEKAAYADYQIAIDYGEKAVKMGTEARKLSVERGQQGPSASGPSATEVPPETAPVDAEKGDEQ